MSHRAAQDKLTPKSPGEGWETVFPCPQAHRPVTTWLPRSPVTRLSHQPSVPLRKSCDPFLRLEALGCLRLCFPRAECPLLPTLLAWLPRGRGCPDQAPLRFLSSLTLTSVLPLDPTPAVTEPALRPGKPAFWFLPCHPPLQDPGRAWPLGAGRHRHWGHGNQRTQPGTGPLSRCGLVWNGHFGHRLGVRPWHHTQTPGVGAPERQGSVVGCGGGRRSHLSEMPVGCRALPLPRAKAGPGGSAGRVRGGRGTRSAEGSARTDLLPLFLMAGWPHLTQPPLLCERCSPEAPVTRLLPTAAPVPTQLLLYLLIRVGNQLHVTTSL